MDLFSELRRTAVRMPDKTAIVHRHQQISYKRLFSAADVVAREFCRQPAGWKVGVLGARDPEFITAMLGLMQAGVIAVPLSPSLRPSELAELAQQLALDEVFVAEQFQQLFPAGPADREVRLPQMTARSADWRRHVLANGAPEPRRAEVLRRGVTTIRWSSGTTGRAKGIMLTDRAVWARVNAHCEMHGIRESDNILFIVSFDAALPALIAYLSIGAGVLLEEAQNVQSMVALAQRHILTHIHATPFFYQMLMTSDVDATCFRDVRHYISTGAPLPVSLSALFRRRMDREINQYYGIGECGPVFFNISDAIEKRGSAGVLLSGCEAKLVDAEGEANSDSGELWVRGPGLFEGYYEPWQPSETVLSDGWFCTGDLARIDAEGNYWIVGRSKYIINVGGSKVFPWEIEDILLSHPSVEEAVVFAVADRRFGEVPHAKVKLRPTQACAEGDLLRDVNSRLSVFKALRKIEFVDELARTPTGKVIQSQ
jgi:long-chain acyl-CoA synthetase